MNSGTRHKRKRQRMGGMKRSPACFHAMVAMIIILATLIHLAASVSAQRGSDGWWIRARRKIGTITKPSADHSSTKLGNKNDDYDEFTTDLASLSAYFTGEHPEKQHRKKPRNKNGKRNKMQDGKDRFFKRIKLLPSSWEHNGKRVTREAWETWSSKLMQKDTAQAFKTVMDIVSRFSDHGVVDVFSLFPTRDVMSSILALSRLQHASLYYQQQEGIVNEYSSPGRNGTDTAEPPNLELLRDLARYSVFANAAYGWKGGLALSGRLHLGDNKALIKKTGIDRRDVVTAHWHSRTHRPAYYVVRDMERKKLVLCIRGTLSPRDILTDLCCTAHNVVAFDEEGKEQDDVDVDPFRATKSNGLGFGPVQSLVDESSSEPMNQGVQAHQGMLEAAQSVSRMTRDKIASELEAHPDLDLVLIGHSLGGGTAAVLGSLWQNIFPGLTVYAYGCPCVMNNMEEEYAINQEKLSIVSVVAEGDVFASLSLGHLADVSSAVSYLCQNEDLRKSVLARTQRNFQEMSQSDLEWSFTCMEQILRDIMTRDKLYPAGRILYLSSSATNLHAGRSGEENKGIDDSSVSNRQHSLRYVSRDKFRDLMLHPRMIDLTRHAPTRYEEDLTQLWSEIEEKSKQ